MKKLSFLLFIALCLGIVTPLLAVEVDEDNAYVIVTTQGYTVHWKKAARMGYMQAFLPGSQDSLIAVGSRAFYHSSSYGGDWKDWQQLQDWEIVEEELGKAVVKYECRDAGSKEYTVLASYYDSAPYIKHEVTITNVGNDAVTSFESGHEPMFEPNMDMDGMNTFNQPFPHATWWVNGGFVALYGPDAESAPLSERDGRNPGRMALVHNNLGKSLKKGDSANVTYYVAFGKGNDKDATDLAADVQKEPTLGKAVSPAGTLTITWGWIRAGY